jgi:hypothetical protein
MNVNEKEIEKEEQEKSLDKRFAGEREHWTEKIDSFSSKLGNMKELVTLQVELYSAMGYLADYKRVLSNLYAKRNYKVRGKRYETLTGIINTQERFNAKDKEYFLEGVLREDLLKNEIINDHIGYLDDIYKILNNMSYSIKYRIELENYQ